MSETGFRYSRGCLQSIKDGPITALEGCLAELRRCAAINPTLTPNRRSFALLMSAHGRRGEVREAVSVYYDMLAQGISPDAEMVEMVVGMCWEGGEVGLAVKVKQDSEKAGLLATEECWCAMIGSKGGSHGFRV